jgi:hypothetical protein
MASELLSSFSKGGFVQCGTLPAPEELERLRGELELIRGGDHETGNASSVPGCHSRLLTFSSVAIASSGAERRELKRSRFECNANRRRRGETPALSRALSTARNGREPLLKLSRPQRLPRAIC